MLVCLRYKSPTLPYIRMAIPADILLPTILPDLFKQGAEVLSSVWN
jgi:hypothetical protein